MLNPYTEADSPDDKQSIMDIKARTEKGELLNMLRKAMDTLEFLSQDAAARLAYDARMKALKPIQ
ncbi:MAG: hypothetical protein K0Q59_1744 [Paenibacillus sp.]|nr:hypothetical protein [Paenibacillus sp.]